MVSTLYDANTSVMTYINPYLAVNVNSEKKHYHRYLFQEAADLGYLITNSSGDPYVDYSATPDFLFGTVDLTNPDAVDWYADIIRTNMLGRGQVGWMHDFGEYVPFDAVLANGSPGQVHNKFPELWASVGRQAITEDDGSLLPVSPAEAESHHVLSRLVTSS
jgi:alpha-glucosidase